MANLFAGTNRLSGQIAQLGNAYQAAVGFAPLKMSDRGGSSAGDFGTPTKTSFDERAGMFGDPTKFGPNDYAGMFGAPSQAPSPQAMPTTAPGGMASLGGDWAKVDSWNSAISAASGQSGVPANLIKAVMKLESNGENLGPNNANATGPMQVVTTIWGDLGYNLFDPAQNIMAGAAILKQFHDEYAGWATQNGIDPWKAALYAYYAGNPYDLSAHDDPNQGGSGMSTGAYGDQIWSLYQQLNGASGNSSGTGGGSGSLQSIFGPGATVPDWGEFNIPSSNGLYEYGSSYGLNGVNHTGLDVPMNYGSPYYAPWAGTVVCGGTNNGPGAGDGCAAFPDTWGGGAGRVELLSPDGRTMLIFGHSATSTFQPGTQVQAGQQLGTSGGMNSPHVHLEARVLTDGGWKIVDPRTVLGNFSAAPQSSSPGGGTDLWNFRQNWIGSH